MRNVLISLFLLLSLSQPMTAQVQPIWPEDLDVLPSFIGGQNALSQYMNDNLQYPDAAEKKGVEGKVYVLFNVEKDGTITDVKIGKSVDPDLDQEAVRLVKNMPKWEPGRKRGKATLVKNMRMPITFKKTTPYSPSSPETATFYGGLPALVKYLTENFHYPEDAKEKGMEGQVLVSFWVESDGSIIDVSASPYAGADRSLTKEAIQLVRRMPRWTPGMRAGKLIRGNYNLLVNFSLNNDKSTVDNKAANQSPFALKGPLKIEEAKDKQQIVKSLPSFPGGEAALDRFLKDNTKYRNISNNKTGLSSSVVVEFVIEADGTPTDFEVVQHIDSIHDNEALRVAKSIPKWIPAPKEEGRLDVCIYTLPIPFRAKASFQLQQVVHFPWGKSTIDNGGYASIDMVGKFLKNNPEFAITIRGYTSTNMEPEQSVKVSEDRATAVKQALIKRHGVEASRITTKGCGATDYISDYWELNNIAFFFIENANDDPDFTWGKYQKLVTEFSANNQQARAKATTFKDLESEKRKEFEAKAVPIERMPSFPGGQTALSQFLEDNMKYPPAAEANGVQGTVQIGFFVEKDGTRRDIKVNKSVDPSLDKEAIRLVKSMPKWIPGKEKNGKLVVLPYVLPITFKLSNSK